MRKFLSLILCLSVFTLANAQEKHWEHNFYIDFGGANTFTDDDDAASMHIGYGLNYYFNKNWSVMPGIALRSKFGIDEDDGAGTYNCQYIDIPVVAQYHLNFNERRAIAFELGPVFSFRVSGDEYYIDAEPDDPLQGKQIYKNFDFGLQPAVYYQAGKHWRLGIKGHIGLIDISKKYPTVAESYHFTDLTASIGFCF